MTARNTEQEDPRQLREDRALAALKEPGQVEPRLRRAEALLRTWHYPSFDAYRAWMLWRERGATDSVLHVRRVTWDRPGEVLRFVHPDGREEIRFGTEPRLLVADAVVDAARWRALEEAAGKLLLPPLAFPKRQMAGLDGETFGVEQDFFHRRMRFEWWSRAPEDWEPLVAWVAQVRDFFEETLP